MKLARKFIALMLAVMHTLTYSATAQQVMNLQNGSTTQVESIQVTEGDSLTINVLNELGDVCQDCRAILETNGLLNNGAIDIWGILAIISPTIINNGVITVQGDLLLSNLGINKEAFFAGMAELSKETSLANGFLLNTGEIRNLTQGLIALVAANGGVHNLGTISSNGGAVALVAGDKVSFPLTRDGVLNISLDGVTGVRGQVFDKNGNLVETQGLVTNDGLIQANGGAIVLQATGAEQIFDSIINHTGIIEAKSIVQENGKIILKSNNGNIHIDNAKIDASGLNARETGGSIQVLTKGNIVVDGKTVVDASGNQGGGEVLIGGDVHGTGLVTAAHVGIGEDVIVKADAVTKGNGGKIVVWSEGATLAYGDFSAQGGAQSGNGGLIETSGKEYLDINDIGINASAGNGESGTWLLDPRNVTISNSNTSNPPGAPGTGVWTFTPVSNTSNVRVSDITGKLNSGTNVTITTGVTGTQNGNITISNAIAKTAGSAATLTLTAAGNILMNSAVTATVGVLNVVLNAGGNINVSQAVTTNGGFVQAQANANVTLTNAAGDITTSGGVVTISADQDANGSGSFSSVAGANMNTAGGNATISGVDFNPLGTINAGVGQVTVIGSQAGATIRIGGGSTPATMQITDAEADLITTNTLTIGNATSGNVFVGDFSPANVSALVIKTGGSVTDNNVAAGDNDAGADITVANLGLQAGGAIDLDLAVNTLGVQAGGATDLSDANGFAIGLVGGITGLSLTNQNLALSGGSFSFGQTLNLGAGSLTLNSTGSVSGTNNQSAEIIANNVAINSVSGIDLEINAGTIAFNNSTSGNVLVEDLAGGLIVGTVGSLIGGTNNAGNITVMTHSPLTIASNVSVGAGANINLHALGNLAADDLTINSGVVVSSTGGNGNILLTAGDTVLLDTNAVLRTTGTGTVTAFAGENFTDSTLNFDGNSNGTVIMNTGSALRSEDGNVTVNALSNTRITEINADSDADNNRGNIFIEARNGFISDRNGGAVNLIGNQAVLSADQGIGDTVVADDDEIETNLNTLDVINSVSGHLNILEVAAGGALNIVRAFQDNGGDLNVRTEDGSLTVNAVGSGVRATSGRMHLEASGNGANDDLVINNNVTSTSGKIELTSGSRDILVGAAGNVASVSGEIQVDSLNHISMANGSVFSTGGLIDLDATNNITVGSLQTSSNSSNAVLVVSQNGAILDGGDANANIRTGVAGGAHLVAKTGVGSTNGLETQVGQLAVKTEVGNIQIFNQGNLNIKTLTDPDTSFQTGFSGGTTNGIQITDPANLNTGNNFIWLTNSGNLNVNSNVTNNDGGNISIYSFGTVGTGDMNINANIQSIGANGDVRVVSGGNMMMAVGATISTQGNGVLSGLGNIAIGAGFNTAGKPSNASTALNPNLMLPLTAQSLIDPSTTPAGSLLDTVSDANANFTMNETSRVFSENGNILTDAQNVSTIGRVDADGNNDGNPLAQHGLTDGVRGNIVSLSRHGSTLDAEGPGEIGNLDFVAEALTLLSGGTIGLPTNKIEIDARSFNAFAIGGVVVVGPGAPPLGGVLGGGATGVSALAAVFLGQTLLGATSTESQLHTKTFSRALRPYSDFVGDHAADFPGYHTYENLAMNTVGLDVDTSAIDQISVRGVTAATKAIPIPNLAQPTQTQLEQQSDAVPVPRAVLAKEPTPPVVVSIPANAIPSSESKTKEGIPEAPAVSN